MSERCPLSGGGMAIESLPDVCLKNCSHLWELALKEQTPELDSYLGEILDELSECNHELYEVVHSHQALQATSESALRHYSLVDMCEGCQTELQDNNYTFNCPNN